ncbi:DUF2142 domain-containing protein [Salinibacterium hongtaonis]|uniref:DUF2142 domain-containing protein n=1 Tax=Homoserinimonas hongtaonis TaxID=2079791 RepID=UPI00131EF60E|nr:DUF2142 domain-containing protein [Salinibacterium hongtaonis]
MWKVFFTAWAALFVLSALWTFATPISAAPDEPAHLVKAASVVRGEFIGTPSGFGHAVHVPQYIAWTHAQSCFAFNDKTSAACATASPIDPGSIVESTTTAGLYNPLYYLVVGWPSLLFETEAGIYAMRLMSALFTTVFLALAFVMVRTWRRPTLPTLALAVTATPMALFLAGTINPNGIETTATLAVFVAMLSIAREPAVSLLSARSAILVVSALAAVNARGLSPLWVAVAIIAPLFLLSWTQLRALLKKRAVISAIVGVGIAAGFALVWLFGTSSLTAGIDTTTAPEYPSTGAPAAYGFVFTIQQTFEFAAHLIGLFGWMDTPAPLIVQFIWATLVGGLLLLAAALLRGREAWVSVGLGAAFLLLPPIIQGLYITSGGFIWQGRYNFPLFVCLVMACAAFAATSVPSPSLDSARTLLPAARRTVFIVAAAMGLGHVLAFAATLRRYVVGEDYSWLDFFRSPEWQPPGGALMLLALCGIAVTVSVALLIRGSWREMRDEVSASSVSS